MAITASLYTGVSGLGRLGDAMQTIGDNISNVSTVGYKRNDFSFSDVMSQTVGTQTGVAQVGRGVGLASVRSNFSIGAFENTSVSTHMAIAGEGFFTVKKPNELAQYFTRAGNFHLDKTQRFVNDADYVLQGYKILDSSGNISALRDVIIEDFYSPPSASTNVTVISNLPDTQSSNNNKVVGEKAMLSNKYLVSSTAPSVASTLYKHTSVVAVYDSLGNKHELTIYYDRQQKWGNSTTDKWEYLVTCGSSEDKRATLSGADKYTGMLARGVMEFDGGKLVNMTMDKFTGRVGNVRTSGSIAVADVNFSINNSLVMQIDGYNFDLEYKADGGWSFKKDSNGKLIKPASYPKAIVVPGTNSSSGFSLNLDGDVGGVADLTVTLKNTARVGDQVQFDINNVSDLPIQDFTIRNTSSSDLGGSTNLPEIITPNALALDSNGTLERDFATDSWYFVNPVQTEAKRSYYSNSNDANTYLKLKTNGILKNGGITRNLSTSNWYNNSILSDIGTMQSDGTILPGYPQVNRTAEFLHKSSGINMKFDGANWNFEQIQNVRVANPDTAYKTAYITGDSTSNSNILINQSALTKTAANIKASWNATTNSWSLSNKGAYSDALINTNKSSKNTIIIDANGSTDIATVTNKGTLNANRLSATANNFKALWTPNAAIVPAGGSWGIVSDSKGAYTYATARTGTAADSKALIIDLDGPNFTANNTGTASQIGGNFTAQNFKVQYNEGTGKWSFNTADATTNTFLTAYPNARIKENSTKTKLIIDIDGGVGLLTSTTLPTDTTKLSADLVDADLKWTGDKWILGNMGSAYSNAVILPSSMNSTTTPIIDLDGSLATTNDQITFNLKATGAVVAGTAKNYTFSVKDFNNSGSRQVRLTSSTLTFDFLSAEKVEYIATASTLSAGLNISLTAATQTATITNTHDNDDIIISADNTTFFGAGSTQANTLVMNIDGVGKSVEILNTDDTDITFTLDSTISRTTGDCVMFNVYANGGGSSAKVEIATKPTFELLYNLDNLIKEKGVTQALAISAKWNGTAWEESGLPHSAGHKLSTLYSGATIIQNDSNANRLAINIGGTLKPNSTELATEFYIDLPRPFVAGETVLFDAVPSGIEGYNKAAIVTEDSGKTMKVYLDGDTSAAKTPHIVYKLNSNSSPAVSDRFTFDIDPSDSGKATPDNYSSAKLSSYVNGSKEYLQINLDGQGAINDVTFEFTVNPQGGSGLGYIAATSTKSYIENSYMYFDISGSTAWQTVKPNNNGYFEFATDFLGGAAGKSATNIALNLGGRYSTDGSWISGDRTSTQYGSNKANTFNETDGYGVGEYQSVSISSDGTVIGKYSNGQNVPLYKIPIARFLNPNGLYKEGNNLFTQTVDSGAPLYNTAGTGGSGSITSNSIENSNVDIAEEFISMITTQRGFQANSKIVTTVDSMLEEVINMKR